MSTAPEILALGRVVRIVENEVALAAAPEVIAVLAGNPDPDVLVALGKIGRVLQGLSPGHRAVVAAWAVARQTAAPGPDAPA